MLEIPRTVIATSDPLNLCDGFSLVPKSESDRRSKGVSHTIAGTVFELNNINLLLFRLGANAKYEVYMGFCGPAYAIKMECEGTAENDKLELTIGEDEIAAGMIFSLILEFSINLRLDLLKIDKIVWKGWHPRLETHWKKLVDAGIKLDFDVLEVLYEIIWAVIGHKGGENAEVLEEIFTDTFRSSWGFYDSRPNSYVKNYGEFAAYPGLNLQIDLSGKFPDWNTANKALSPFHSHISFGPLVGFQIPVKVSIKSVSLDTTKYSDVKFSRETETISCTTDGTTPGDATTMNVELEHTVGFDIVFGAFCHVTLAKLVNCGASVSFPLLSLFGLDVHGKSYSNKLSNTIGTTVAEACSTCGPMPTAFMEVIFETPNGLTL